MESLTTDMSVDATAVSVVIPAYNAERYLGETLASVTGQTALPGEVIVVDDGSTDATVEIARRYGARVISVTNGGPAVARNIGTRAARGEFVAYMDADDLWEPEKLALQMSALRAYGSSAFSFTDFRMFDGRAIDQASGLHHHPAFRQVLQTAGVGRDDPLIVIAASSEAPVLPDCYIQPSSVLARREDILAVGGFDGSLVVAEDYDFFLRLLKIVPAVVVMKVLMLYRQHGNQATSNQIKCKTAIIDVARRVAMSPERYPPGDVRYMPTIEFRRYYDLGIEQARRERFDDAVQSLERSLASRRTVRAQLALLGTHICRSRAGRATFEVARAVWKSRPGKRQ